MSAIKVLQLYPRDMSIYGDRGNTLTLTKRLGWHGYEVELLSHNPGDQLPEQVDILVGGGGQDSAQERIQDDLQKVAPQLRAWASDGVPMLVICGLYQLFGHEFRTVGGEVIPGIDVLDAHTVGGPKRLIGNLTVETDDFGKVVGYENHSGLTTLGSQARPLGRVSGEWGNNGRACARLFSTTPAGCCWASVQTMVCGLRSVASLTRVSSRWPRLSARRWRRLLWRSKLMKCF